MSALPLKADMAPCSRHVRFPPKAELRDLGAGNRLTESAPATAIRTASPYSSWRAVGTPSSASRASEKRSLLSLGVEICGTRQGCLGIGGNCHRTQHNCHSGQRHCEFSHALPPDNEAPRNRHDCGRVASAPASPPEYGPSQTLRTRDGCCWLKRVKS